MKIRRQYIIASVEEYVNFMREHIEQLLQSIAGQTAFACSLALNEAVNNAFFHGRRDGEVKVSVLVLRNRRISIRVCDSGPGFAVANTALPVKADELLWEGSGRGVLLMRSFMDQVIYNRRGNEVMLIKKIEGTNV